MAEILTLIDTEKVTKHKIGSWEKLAKDVIDSCPKIKKEREKKILCERFGIGRSSRTLDASGKDIGVTRERIRQIVNNAVRKIQKYCESKDALAKIAKIEQFIKTSGGYTADTALYAQFAGEEKLEQNAVKFIASLSKELEVVKESKQVRAGWNHRSLKQSKIKEMVSKAVEYLKSENKVLPTAQIAEKLKIEGKQTGAILSAAKAIMATDDGKWGLTIWPHVNPKSIRDKSKYIMVRHGKPIHYDELTKKISDISKKPVTKQSVHNELIKAGEFVLVGRGIYALAEWGYKPGVVEEVIVTVLEEAGEPMHKDDIVKKVLERRIVKVSTIILNLQKKRFKRIDRAIYDIAD